jgi:hypothetical protein
MIDAVTMLLAAWAAHPEHGFNELALSLPRAAPNGRTLPRASGPITFYNDVEHPDVLESLNPSTVPCMLFWGDSTNPVRAPETYLIARDIHVAVAYVTEDTADISVANSMCALFFRAAMISMQRYNHIKFSKDFRELNGVKIHEVTAVKDLYITAAKGRRKMWGLLDIEVTAVETYS